MIIHTLTSPIPSSIRRQLQRNLRFPPTPPYLNTPLPTSTKPILFAPMRYQIFHPCNKLLILYLKSLIFIHLSFKIVTKFIIHTRLDLKIFQLAVKLFKLLFVMLELLAARGLLVVVVRLVCQATYAFLARLLQSFVHSCDCGLLLLVFFFVMLKFKFEMANTLLFISKDLGELVYYLVFLTDYLVKALDFTVEIIVLFSKTFYSLIKFNYFFIEPLISHFYLVYFLISPNLRPNFLRSLKNSHFRHCLQIPRTNGRNRISIRRPSTHQHNPRVLHLILTTTKISNRIKRSYTLRCRMLLVYVLFG